MKKCFSATAIAVAALVLLPAAAWAHHVNDLTVTCDTASGTLTQFKAGDYSLLLAVYVDGQGHLSGQHLTVAANNQPTDFSFDIADFTDQQGATTHLDAQLFWDGPEKGQSPVTAFDGECGTVVETTTTTTTQPAPTTTTTTPATTTTTIEPQDHTAVPPYGGGDIGTPIAEGPAFAPKAAAPAPADELPRTGSNGWLAIAGFVLAAGGFALVWCTRDRSHGWWDSQQPTNRLR